MSRGERRSFGLVPRRAVKVPDPRLSASVLLVEGGKGSVCTIGFHEALVQFVGQKLPRGVAAHDPAFLVVTQDERRGLWVVEAHYVRDTTTALLWETRERPSWLKTPLTVEDKNAHAST